MEPLKQFKFNPGETLDAITDQVTIDGYTQDSGVSAANSASSPNPFNGTLLIEIDGSAAGASDGITFDPGSENSVLRGIVINGFQNKAISLNTSNITIAGNYIGTDPTGTINKGNFIGIAGSGTDETIGGPLPADRNIIDGNNSSAAYPSDRWVFQGNYIGVDATGIAAIGNSSISGSGGISIDNCSDVVIGGASTDDANVISGNLSHGLAPDNATNITIQGNFIGTDYSGTLAIGNGVGGTGAGITTQGTTGVISGNIIANNPGDGIYLNDDTDLTIQGNRIGTGTVGTESFGNGQNGISANNGTNGVLIGGTSPGDGNIIANNTQNGISIGDNNDGTKDNSILGNSIHDDGDLGIDLQPNLGVIQIMMLAMVILVRMIYLIFLL